MSAIFPSGQWELLSVSAHIVRFFRRWLIHQRTPRDDADQEGQPEQATDNAEERPHLRSVFLLFVGKCNSRGQGSTQKQEKEHDDPRDRKLRLWRRGATEPVFRVIGSCVGVDLGVQE